MPCRDDRLLRIDPSKDTVSVIYTSLKIEEKGWHWPIEGSNGFIYAVPHSSGRVLKIDPHTEEMRLIGVAFKNQEPGVLWNGAVLGSDKNIYAFPAGGGHDQILVIDSELDSVSLYPKRLNVGAKQHKFTGAVRYQNGSIFSIATSGGGGWNESYTSHLRLDVPHTQLLGTRGALPPSSMSSTIGDNSVLIGDGYVGVGVWRFGMCNKTHFIFSHQVQGIRMIAKSDGSVIRGHFGDICSPWIKNWNGASNRIKTGERLIDFDNTWRLVEINDAHLALSHIDGETSIMWRRQGDVVTGPMVWDGVQVKKKPTSAAITDKKEAGNFTYSRSVLYGNGKSCISGIPIIHNGPIGSCNNVCEAELRCKKGAAALGYTWKDISTQNRKPAGCIVDVSSFEASFNDHKSFENDNDKFAIICMKFPLSLNPPPEYPTLGGWGIRPFGSLRFGSKYLRLGNNWKLGQGSENDFLVTHSITQNTYHLPMRETLGGALPHVGDLSGLSRVPLYKRPLDSRAYRTPPFPEIIYPEDGTSVLLGFLKPTPSCASTEKTCSAVPEGWATSEAILTLTPS